MTSESSYIEFRTDENGNEIAIVPVCDPDTPGPIPHAYMAMVNGAVDRMMYLNRPDAITRAAEVSAMPARNPHDPAGAP